MSSAPTASSDAVTVGRGALFIALAKVVFLITGATTSFALAALLPPDAYGDYGLAIRVVSLVNMVVVQGLLQGMSRAVSHAPTSSGPLLRQGRRAAPVIGGAAGLILLVTSPLIAQLMADEKLTPLIMVSSAIPLSYAFYACMVGVVNGLQRFKVQALLDMGFSTGKMVFILAGATLGFGAIGSVAGFALAALVMAVVTATQLRRLDGDPPPTPLTLGGLLSFSGWVMGYQALLSLLMFVDLALVRRAAGLGQLSDDIPGLYAAAINMAQVPYLGCTAVTFVIFPLLGRAATDVDSETAKATVEKAIRYALLIIMPPAVAFMAAAPGAVTFLFPQTYANAADPLRVLAAAYVATALCSVVCTMLNALGKPQYSGVSVLVGAAVSVVSGSLLLPVMGVMGAAAGSAAGMTVSTLIAFYFLAQSGRARVPLSSLARHAAVAAMVTAPGLLVTWPQGTPMARLIGLGGTVVAALLTIVLLIVTREIGKEHWEMLSKIFRRRGAQ